MKHEPWVTFCSKPGFLAHLQIQLLFAPAAVAKVKTYQVRLQLAFFNQVCNLFKITTPVNTLDYFHAALYQVRALMQEMKGILLHRATIVHREAAHFQICNQFSYIL